MQVTAVSDLPPGLRLRSCQDVCTPFLAGFKMYYDIGTSTNIISKYTVAKQTLWNLAPDEAFTPSWIDPDRFAASEEDKNVPESSPGQCRFSSRAG